MTTMKTCKAVVGLAVTVMALGSTGGAMAASGTRDEGVSAPASADRHYLGKPHAPIGATFRTTGTLSVGVPADVHVTIAADPRAQAVTVEFTAGDGLAIVSPVGLQQFTVESGKSVETTVRVVPQSGGSLRLTAQLTLMVGGERQSRPVSVALNVKGPVTVVAAKPAPTERDAQGRLVQPMQAVTTVRQ